MALRLGDVAPNFKANSTLGSLDFYQWLGDSWCILCLRSSGFTPVCGTELARTTELKAAFKKRNVKILAASKNPLDQFTYFLKDLQETDQPIPDFPLVADEEGQLAALYDMIPHKGVAMCCLFVIAPDKTIKLITAYPPSTGRNFREILRTIDSLQLTAYHDVATPVDWEWGEDVFILPALNAEQADLKFPRGYESMKPYMRVTPQPVL